MNSPIDERRQLRVPQTIRTTRPYTAVESSAPSASGTNDYLHVGGGTLTHKRSGGGLSSNASTLRPYSTTTTYMESDAASRMPSDSFFTPLDPMRPPDHWEFGTSNSASIGLGRQFSNSSVQSALARDAAYGAGLPDSHANATGFNTVRTLPATLGGDLGLDIRSLSRMESHANRPSLAIERGGYSNEFDDISTSITAGTSVPATPIIPPSIVTTDTAGFHGHYNGTTSSKRMDALTVHTGRTGLSSQSGNTELTSYYGNHAASAVSGVHGGTDLSPSTMDGPGMGIPSVRIEREHRQDERYRFQVDPLPTVFDGRITPDELRDTITTLNNILAQGDEGTGKSFLRHSLACAIFYVGFCCTRSDYQETLDKAQAFLAEENRRLYLSRGLRWRDPRQTAFLHLELLL
ncbi:Golgin subfamily A member 7/ERF4 family-domain-containing protein, partial [Syncephalis plumigaleata]